jgi:hypothetical protein
MTPTAASVTYGHDASIARFSVDRYQRMIETGILTADDKVELLENYGAQDAASSSRQHRPTDAAALLRPSRLAGIYESSPPSP